MTILQSARRRVALWICPELALRAPQRFDPADLPVFRGKGGVPGWWANAELREFLTSAHRRMRLVDAVATATDRFGADAPSKSAIQRYWAQLDAHAAVISGTPTQPTVKEAS